MGDEKIAILYVDDEEINLRLFKSTFRKEFDISTANSAKDGLEILDRKKIDVLITDQRMPEMTGNELLKEVNDRYPAVPPGRLILSGYSMPQIISEAFKKFNLYKFISKPWDEANLRQIFHDSMIAENYGK